MTEGPDPEQAPIFVVGTGRSGTTLLRLMLCAHPRIHLTHEASFWLWEGLATRRASGEDVLARYLRSVHCRWLQLDPREVLADVPRPVTRSRLPEVYAAFMRAQAARQGKVRWGDKTPSHSAHLGAMLEAFPDARIVRIVRDPRSTVRSFQRMPWATPSAAGAAVLVDQERRQAEPFRERLLEVRLEDLLADPEAVLRRVLDHVEEAWDDAVLAHHAHLPDPDDTPDVPWFRRAGRPLTPYRPVDWAAEDPVEVRLLERLTERAMVAHDYVPATLPVEPSRWAVLWRWVRDLPAFFHGVWILLLLVRRAQRGAQDDRAEHALFRRLNPDAWTALGEGFEMPQTPEHPDGWEEVLTP